MVVTALVAALTVLAATGWFLMDQSSRGILDGKRQASLAEASVVLDGMLALAAHPQPAHVVDQRAAHQVGPGCRLPRFGRQSVLRGGGRSGLGHRLGRVEYGNVPESLRRAVLRADGIYSTPTEIRFTDARRRFPVLAIGSALTAPRRHPLTRSISCSPSSPEAETPRGGAARPVVAGLIVLVGVVATVYLIAVQVLRPIRAARRWRPNGWPLGTWTIGWRYAAPRTWPGLARSMNHLATGWTAS